MTKDNASNVANLSLEVYNRLYEVGKKRQHLRNDSQSHKLLLSPNKHTNSTSVIMTDQQSSQKEIKSEHSFKPQIQLRS